MDPLGVRGWLLGGHGLADGFFRKQPENIFISNVFYVSFYRICIYNFCLHEWLFVFSGVVQSLHLVRQMYLDTMFR